MNSFSSLIPNPLTVFPSISATRSLKVNALKADATFAERATFQALHGLQGVLSAITRSLTALGNNANAYFAQLSATLALDRAAHSMAHAIGITPRFNYTLTPFSNPFSIMPSFQPLTTTHFATAMMENSFAMMASSFGAMANAFGFFAVRR